MNVFKEYLELLTESEYTPENLGGIANLVEQQPGKWFTVNEAKKVKVKYRQGTYGEKVFTVSNKGVEHIIVTENVFQAINRVTTKKLLAQTSKVLNSLNG